MRATILFLFLVPYAVSNEPPEFIQRLLGTETLQIGFAENCYLHWFEKPRIQRRKRHQKPTEFRCGTKSGCEIEIEPAGNDRYLLRNGNKYMYWLGLTGNIKPMQFREETPQKKGDTFWIRKQKDGMFAIIANAEHTECPLYRKDTGDIVKFPAEFRCHEPIKDTFWIKGEDCKAKIIEPVETGAEATLDGEEIVGHVTSGTCSSTIQQTVILGHTNTVTEEINVEVSKSEEVNWETSANIAFTAAGSFLGTGVETTFSVGISQGGATTFGSSETKSTGLSNSKDSSTQVHFRTPGAAMIIGYVKRFVFDKSNVPAKVTAECKNGHQFVFDTTIKLRSKVFGSTSFSTDAVEFKRGKCNQQSFRCMRNVHFESFLEVTRAQEAFKECFPPELIISQEEMKKRKAMEEKSSSNSENKESSKSTDKTF